MSKFLPRVRRTLQGLGIAVPVLGVATGIWYQQHYVLPPEAILKRAVPQPNGYDTIQAAGKLLVKEHNGVHIQPRMMPESSHFLPETPATLAQRKAFVRANQPTLTLLRKGLTQTYHDQSGERFPSTWAFALPKTVVFAGSGDRISS